MGIAYRSVLKDIGTGGISVDSVTITSYPDTTTYFAGDKLDLSGLVVYAEIGSLSGDVTNDCTFIPADGDILTASTNKITVKYGNEKLDIPLTVVMPTAITITSQPTKTTYKTDEHLNFTGLIVTASNSEAGLSTDVTSACTFNPAEGTVLDEEKTYTISVSYGSLSATFDVTVSPIPSTLEECTWEQISSLVKSGKFAEHFKTGDTKSIVVNGVTYVMSAEINDGTGTAATYYPANTVDFIINKIKATSRHNKSDFVNITYANGSFIRSYCTSIYNSLPADVKSVVIPKQKIIYTAENETATINDNVWILSPIELGMSQPQNTTGYGYKTLDSTSYSKIYNIGNTTAKRAALLSEQDMYIGIWTSNSYIMPGSGGTYRSFGLIWGSSEKYSDGATYPNGVHGVLWGFRIG